MKKDEYESIKTELELICAHMFSGDLAEYGFDYISLEIPPNILGPSYVRHMEKQKGKRELYMWGNRLASVQLHPHKSVKIYEFGEPNMNTASKVLLNILAINYPTVRIEY